MLQKIVSIIVFSLLIMSCNSTHTEVHTTTSADGILQERFSAKKQSSEKHGMYQKFYPTGTVQEQANYQDNLLVGKHQFFYPDGRVEIEEEYSAGALHGPYKKYYPNGTLALEQEFVQGMLKGKSRAWYENGTLKEELLFDQNEENGPFSEFHENGNLKARGTYLNGATEQDSLFLYDLNGGLERIMLCEKGICKTIFGKKLE